jgi:hypothetical protein
MSNQKFARIGPLHPAGRPGAADEIVEAIVFLAPRPRSTEAAPPFEVHGGEQCLA